MAKFNFNVSEVAPRTGSGDPIPAGTYLAEITSSEIKALKSGNGNGLSLEFTVIEPEAFSGRKCWAHLNVEHSNAKAQEIGRGDLSAINVALGGKAVEDSDDLFGKVLQIRTKLRPAEGDYPSRAEVIGYMAPGAKTPATAVAPPPTVPASSKPWARKAA